MQKEKLPVTTASFLLFIEFCQYFLQHFIGHAGPCFDDIIAILDGFGIKTALILALFRLCHHFLELDSLFIHVVDIGAVISGITGLFYRTEGQGLHACRIGNFCCTHINGRKLIVLPYFFLGKSRNRHSQG